MPNPISVTVKGLQRFTDPYGKEGIYHCATGIPITAEPGSAEFFLGLFVAEAVAKTGAMNRTKRKRKDVEAAT
jgi:hypothetical protein